MTHHLIFGQQVDIQADILNLSAPLGAIPYEASEVNGNLAFGLNSQKNLANGTETGTNNVTYGSFTGGSLTSGSNNTFSGWSSGQADTTGSNNTFDGYESGFSCITGHDNVLVGYEAGFSIVSSSDVVAVGSQCLSNTSTVGAMNATTAAGFQCGQNAQTAFTGFGKGAGQNCNATGCSYFGVNAGQGVTSPSALGININAFGQDALQLNNGGVNSCAFGTFTLQNYAPTAGTGASNGFGVQALTLATTGTAMNAFGYSAGGSCTSAANCVLVGNGTAGTMATGTRDVCLGNAAGSAWTGAESSNIIIDNAGVSGDSGQIRIGTSTVHTACTIQGISGSTSSSGVEVYVNAAGVLGTSTSNAEEKTDFSHINAEHIIQQIPVRGFRYRDNEQVRQVGTNIQDLARIGAWDLVDREQGAIRSRFLTFLLIDEVQRLNREIKSIKNEEIIYSPNYSLVY